MLRRGGLICSAAMSRSHRELGALAEELERAGADRERLVLVRCALNFKRAWVDLAEALAGLQHSRAYRRWGFEDLHSYCSAELHVKPATVDKLLLSLSAVRTYAPQVLSDRAVPADVPSMDAVEYFTRAVDFTERKRSRGDAEGDGDEPASDVVDQLRAAVFDEGRSVAELRKQFNPVFRPKAPEAEALEQVRKARATAQRLMELVRGVEALTEKRIARTEAAIEALVRDLDGIAPPASRGKAKAAEEQAAVN